MTHSPTWIDLDGAVNVRDLAGTPTTDGRRVRAGRLVRADNLQDLTPADVRRLVDDLGVRSVVDLRTTDEVDAEGPGPLRAEPDVAHHHLSLIPESGSITDAVDVERRGAAASYLRYLDQRGDAVVEALRVVAGSTGATVVHCAAGKDRTGTVVALALAAVGADRDAIVADYAASAERIEPILQRLVTRPAYADAIGTSMAEADVDRQRPRPETMRALLEALDEESGGPAGWLAAHGWTDADDAALRAQLLD